MLLTRSQYSCPTGPAGISVSHTNWLSWCTIPLTVLVLAAGASNSSRLHRAQQCHTENRCRTQSWNLLAKFCTLKTLMPTVKTVQMAVGSVREIESTRLATKNTSGEPPYRNLTNSLTEIANPSPVGQSNTPRRAQYGTQCMQGLHRSNAPRPQPSPL